MEYVREEGERQLQKLTSDQPVRQSWMHAFPSLALKTRLRLGCAQDAMMRIKKAREAAAAEEYAADVRAQAERQAERCATVNVLSAVHLHQKTCARCSLERALASHFLASRRAKLRKEQAAARAAARAAQSDEESDSDDEGGVAPRAAGGAALRGRGRGKRGRGPSFIF